ncbi:phage major capsid protein, partial [Enterococcus faecalis]
SKTGDEAHNLVVSIRQALTLLRKVGANANAVLLNPADAEKIDLLEDANKRFLGNGPFAVGPSTIWSRTIVECDQLAAGKV